MRSCFHGGAEGEIRRFRGAGDEEGEVASCLAYISTIVFIYLYLYIDYTRVDDVVVGSSRHARD